MAANDCFKKIIGKIDSALTPEAVYKIYLAIKKSDNPSSKISAAIAKASGEQDKREVDNK